MLYKKIHRQFLREFRVGRKFKYNKVVYEVTEKPHIDPEYIYSVVSDNKWPLIPLVDAPIYYYPDKGERTDEDYIEWLN